MMVFNTFSVSTTKLDGSIDTNLRAAVAYNGKNWIRIRMNNLIFPSEFTARGSECAFSRIFFSDSASGNRLASSILLSERHSLSLNSYSILLIAILFLPRLKISKAISSASAC